jgi:2-(3-amino-3-carboxypropyl)histidine synthase
MNYDFNITKICNMIRNNKYKIVGLQFPEGLKLYATRVAQQIEKTTDILTIISGDPCYGACDLALDLKKLGVDAIFHFGHSQIPHSDVIFVEVQPTTEFDISFIDPKMMDYATLCVVTTIQHMQLVKNKLKEIEKIVGKKVIFGGCVKGCDFTSVKSVDVECYLFIGDGDFHPLGISLTTTKKVVSADLYRKVTKDITDLKHQILKQRWGAIVKTRDSKSITILVSTKSGQCRPSLAIDLRKKINDSGKLCNIVALREIVPENLKVFKTDIFVCVGCPRIPIDDYLKFDKPIITPIELEIALRYRKWEDYRI